MISDTRVAPDGAVARLRCAVPVDPPLAVRTLGQNDVTLDLVRS